MLAVFVTLMASQSEAGSAEFRGRPQRSYAEIPAPKDNRIASPWDFCVCVTTR